MIDKRPRQNYLGIAGWVWAGDYKMERYLYLLHRITGLGLMLFGVFHLIATTIFRMQGEAVWESTMAFLNNPLFAAGEYLVVVAFAYHALNGLRLILQELGFSLGKPVPPIYPFRDAIRRKRLWTVVTMAAVMVLVVLFFINFTSGGPR